MNATPVLSRVLRALRDHRLDAVLIGNAAAAIHGAPVTTLDFDFMFRDTPANTSKRAAGRDRDKAVLSILEQTRTSSEKRGCRGS